MSRKLFNSAVGEIEITQHVWDRFLERKLKAPVDKKSSPEEVFDQLSQSFASATLVTLPQAIAFRRMLNNNCVAVFYLFNPNDELRFIVSQDPPRKLFTVEKALSRRARKKRSPSQMHDWMARYFTKAANKQSC